MEYISINLIISTLMTFKTKKKNKNKNKTKSIIFPYVKTYMIHLLGTYVTILCNWLIL